MAKYLLCRLHQRVDPQSLTPKLARSVQFVVPVEIFLRVKINISPCRLYLTKR